MAKKSAIARETKRRKMVDQYAERRKQLKAEGNYEELQKLPRNVFREMALDGKIPGVRKSSW